LRAEIFRHASGAIYVPEVRVFGDVQQTLVNGTESFRPVIASRNLIGVSRKLVPICACPGVFGTMDV